MVNKNENKGYAKSPYNFIPFPEKIFYRHVLSEEYENKDKGITELPRHDKFRQDLKTGYIDYLIEAETPLFISDGEKDFFKVNGEYVIPGSTVRGKARSNAEVLSCSYPEFIENKKLWFRGAFSKDVLKEMYRQEVLSGKTGKINEKVKAGYLCRNGQKWFIIPATKDSKSRYFREIHESELRANENVIDESIVENIFMYEKYDLKDKKNLWSIFFDMKNKKKKINKKIKEKELSRERKKGIKNMGDDLQKEINNLKKYVNNLQKRIENLLENNETSEFKRYYYKASYYLKKNNSLGINKIVESTDDENYGFLMNSTRLNYKQNHYLIFRKDTDKARKTISQDLINQYETSVKCKQGEEVENFKIDEDNEFINGKEKPIFYITDKEENIISFGFTPYLKIPYKSSVRDGVKVKDSNNEEVKKGKIDYAKGIFGFTNFEHNDSKKGNKTTCYKGRVSFTNAKPLESYEQIEPILKHLMNPKISSFQLYLKQDSNNIKNLKTYSSDDFELRGEKFYWLKDKHDDKQENNSNKNQCASLYPVNSGSIFKGRIYFENLCEDELGLLLMSIKPFKGAKENLGQGKPYGYGRVNFQIEDIVEIDSKNRFMNLNIDSSKKSIKKSKDNYIKKFKKYMNKQDINVDFEDEIMYRCFYVSKSKIQKIDDKEFNYMELDKFKEREILKSTEKYIEEGEVGDAKKYVAATNDSKDK